MNICRCVVRFLRIIFLHARICAVNKVLFTCTLVYHSQLFCHIRNQNMGIPNADRFLRIIEQIARDKELGRARTCLGVRARNYDVLSHGQAGTGPVLMHARARASNARIARQFRNGRCQWRNSRSQSVAVAALSLSYSSPSPLCSSRRWRFITGGSSWKTRLQYGFS